MEYDADDLPADDEEAEHDTALEAVESVAGLLAVDAALLAKLLLVRDPANMDYNQTRWP